MESVDKTWDDDIEKLTGTFFCLNTSRKDPCKMNLAILVFHNNLNWIILSKKKYEFMFHFMLNLLLVHPTYYIVLILFNIHCQKPRALPENLQSFLQQFYIWIVLLRPHTLKSELNNDEAYQWLIGLKQSFHRLKLIICHTTHYAH